MTTKATDSSYTETEYPLSGSQQSEPLLAWQVLITRLKTSLEDILVRERRSLSEYELIRALSSSEYVIFDEDALRGNLALFQTHFVLFHALYQCRVAWWKQHGLALEINPLKIQAVEPSAPSTSNSGSDQQDLTSTDPLADYYLDFSNLTDTSEKDVDALLTRFWQDLMNPGQCLEAREILGCEKTDDWPEIRHRYRRLAMAHHPDRGGCPKQFRQINEAYEVLKVRHSR